MATARAFNSFSGADVTALFNNIQFAEIQHIQYSVSREKVRLWTLGSADPRSISRGKRSIGGVLVFAMVDSNTLIAAWKASATGTSTSNGGKFYSKFGEIKTDSNPNNINEFTAQMLQQGGTTTVSPAGTLLSSPDNTDILGSDGSRNNFFSFETEPWYPDQIPPFQLSLVASNEYGTVATAKLFGVELIEEGSGVGIDDIVIEEQYGFMALGYQRWTRLVSASTGFGTFTPS